MKDQNKKTNEEVHVNPNMNTQSMGPVELPGDPGSMNSFADQSTGSGDAPDGGAKPNKKDLRLLSYSDFVKLLGGK